VPHEEDRLLRAGEVREREKKDGGGNSFHERSGVQVSTVR